MVKNPPTQDITITTLNKFSQSWVKWFQSLMTEINVISGGGP